ncbi:MAG: hypothetical protein GF317_20460, partial [Candidatus Lokiarchaeota archaeon]|nr:hypothetical protein [Candidatus Lokiarchaeota archaeon]
MKKTLLILILSLFITAIYAENLSVIDKEKIENLEQLQEKIVSDEPFVIESGAEKLMIAEAIETQINEIKESRDDKKDTNDLIHYAFYVILI